MYNGDMVTTGYDTYWVLPYFYSMFCIYIYKPWAMLCIPYLHSVSVSPIWTTTHSLLGNILHSVSALCICIGHG